MPEERYSVEHILVQGDAGPEPITVGGAILVAPFSKAATNVRRDDNDIRRSLPIDEAGVASLMADSIEDVCATHDVRITGEYVDVDGEVKPVDIAVRNDRDFTISEMTRRSPGLRNRYLEMRQCEALAAEMDRHERSPLTAEEIQTLEQLAAMLEASAPAEEDGR